MVPVRSLSKHAALGTAGSLVAAYGLREFLRATGGGYYCCNHFVYRAQGALMVFVGWMFLLGAVYGPYREQYAGS